MKFGSVSASWKGSAPVLIPAFCVLSLTAFAVGAQRPPEPRVVGDHGLLIEAVTTEPADPTVDDLCRLKVRISNHGALSASRLKFEVRINGVALPAYERFVSLDAIGPGETASLELYRFWTSETARPVKPGQKLTVEVGILSAAWVELSHDDEGWDVSKVVRQIEELPASRVKESVVQPSKKSVGKRQVISGHP